MGRIFEDHQYLRPQRGVHQSTPVHVRGRNPRGNGKSWLAAHILSRVLSPEDELFRDGSESVLAPRPLRADPDDVAEVPRS